MSYLLKENVFTEENVYSITVTPSSGTVTDSTNKNKILTRQLSDSYIFTPSATGTVTIEIIVYQLSTSISSIALLSSAFGSINNIKYDVLNAGTMVNMSFNNTVTRTRSIRAELSGGFPSTSTIYYNKDIVKIGSNTAISQTYEIILDVSAGQEYYIGKVFAVSETEDIKINPTSYSETAIDTVKTDVSNGGQKYSTDGYMINSVKFTIPKLTQDESEVIRSLNYNQKTQYPVILIPFVNTDMVIYGAQKTLAKLSPLLSNNSATDWYWKATMHIEEEL